MRFGLLVFRQAYRGMEFMQESFATTRKREAPAESVSACLMFIQLRARAKGIFDLVLDWHATALRSPQAPVSSSIMRVSKHGVKNFQ